MKTSPRLLQQLLLHSLPLPLLFLAICLIPLLSGCGSIAIGTAVAQGITGVAEISAGNMIQKKEITVAQLNTLATDLAAYPNTPLPQADTGLEANLVTELIAHRAANLTDASVVDAVNNAISALNATASPTAAQGIMWADLQDVVAGLKAEVKEATANPTLVPSSATLGAFPSYVISR